MIEEKDEPFFDGALFFDDDPFAGMPISTAERPSGRVANYIYRPAKGEKITISFLEWLHKNRDDYYQKFMRGNSNRDELADLLLEWQKSDVKNARLVLSNSRCEWLNLIGERCQNTMSLKFHHRTYDREGHESYSDFSLFCPAHHFIADMYRKTAVGQRDDVIFDRMFNILWNKIRGFDDLKKDKVVRRIAREWDAFRVDQLVGTVVLNRYFELIERGDISVHNICLSSRDIDVVSLAINYMDMIYRIVSLPDYDNFHDANTIIKETLRAVL